MAYVTELSHVVSDSNGRLHKDTAAGWHRAERNGEPVFQLDSYGSPDRQDTGTKSQTLQLDAVRAQELVDAMRTVFPGLR